MRRVNYEWSPFDKARFNNGVSDLIESLANTMLVQVEGRLSRSGNTEVEMEFVLDLNGVNDPERRHAYKSYFGYAWAERRRKRFEGRDEREFIPLDEDGKQ